MRLAALVMVAVLAAVPVRAATILPGNSTDITLAIGSVLTAIGATVAPLGTASVDFVGSAPVARFPITGGTSLPSGLTILHQGSGLRFENFADSLEISDFIIDTAAARVFADVAIGGVPVFTDAPIFAIQPGLVLTLTVVAADEVNRLLGFVLFDGQSVIGTAVTNPNIAVPVPAAGALLLTGMLAMTLVRRRRLG